MSAEGECEAIKDGKGTKNLNKTMSGVFVASLKEVLSVEREALDVVRLGDDVGGADVRLEQRLLPEVVSASETPDRLFAAV